MILQRIAEQHLGEMADRFGFADVTIDVANNRVRFAGTDRVVIVSEGELEHQTLKAVLTYKTTMREADTMPT